MAGPTIRFVGRVNDHETKRYLERCRGLIFPGQEDFGIAPVEAQACGKPVVALAAGGALETVIPDETGVLFPDPTEEGLVEATERAERIKWTPYRVRENAERFSKQIFLRKTEELIRRVTGTELYPMNSYNTAQRN
jgi:glycosyltransferase involved in cell wall biosynthesis